MTQGTRPRRRWETGAELSGPCVVAALGFDRFLADAIQSCRLARARREHVGGWQAEQAEREAADWRRIVQRRRSIFIACLRREYEA